MAVLIYPLIAFVYADTCPKCIFTIQFSDRSLALPYITMWPSNSKTTCKQPDIFTKIWILDTYVLQRYELKIHILHIDLQLVSMTRDVLVSVNFGCLSPSMFSHFHCNAMRKTIKAHKNLLTNLVLGCAHFDLWFVVICDYIKHLKSNMWY